MQVSSSLSLPLSPGPPSIPPALPLLALLLALSKVFLLLLFLPPRDFLSFSLVQSLPPFAFLPFAVYFSRILAPERFFLHCLLPYPIPCSLSFNSMLKNAPSPLFCFSPNTPRGGHRSRDASGCIVVCLPSACICVRIRPCTLATAHVPAHECACTRT